VSDTQLKTKVKQVKYPLELKKKILLELADSGSVETVDHHYGVRSELFTTGSRLKEEE